MKNIFKIKIKERVENYYVFDNMLFTFYNLEIDRVKRKVKFIGIIADEISNQRFFAYKNSTIELEMLERYIYGAIILGLFSDKWTLRLIKKYLAKYKGSAIIDTSFENVEYGDRIGYMNFKSFNSDIERNKSCVDMANYIYDNGFKKQYFCHNSYSFVDKTYTKAEYQNIC